MPAKLVAERRGGRQKYMVAVSPLPEEQGSLTANAEYTSLCPMHTQVIAERIRCVADARGLLFEPVDRAILQTQANVHVVLTLPGCVRGNHRHLRGTEIAVVTGEALVRVKEGEGGEIRDYLVRPGEVWRFTIPPGTPHAFKNTGNAPMLLIGFNTVPHDPAKPDTAREDLIPT